MVKNTMNNEWRTYVRVQIQKGVSKDKLRKILVKQNYSKKIIDEVINKEYETKNTIINTSNNKSKSSELKPKPQKYVVKGCILGNMDEETKSNLNIISTDPIIYVIDDFIDECSCEHIVELSKDKYERAKVCGDKKGQFSNGRTGKNCWITHDEDLITLEIADRISELVGIPLENAESFQSIYYDKGQEYRIHYDSWDLDNSPKMKRSFKTGGQRLLTVLGYLNDVEKGGGTRFSKLNKVVQAKKGRIVIFQNVEFGTNKKHIKSQHAGMPVIEGEKYAFNLWFREHDINKPYPFEELKEK